MALPHKLQKCWYTSGRTLKWKAFVCVCVQLTSKPFLSRYTKHMTWMLKRPPCPAGELSQNDVDQATTLINLVHPYTVIKPIISVAIRNKFLSTRRTTRFCCCSQKKKNPTFLCTTSQSHQTGERKVWPELNGTEKCCPVLPLSS